VAGGTLQFTHTSIDPERDPLTYKWLLDGTVKANTQSWTYQPTNSEVGFHNVTLVVSDGSLSVKMEWNITVIGNNPPTITAYTPTIDYPCIKQGNQQTFTVTATDPDGDPVAYEWYLNNNLVSTTDAYTFSATSGTSGAHTVTVIVKDSYGAQTSRKWYLTVDANLVMPFDTNTTMVVDYAGYDNNGTVYNARWTPNGKINGAYIFDGDDYIRIEDSPNLGGDGTWSQITIEFWIYVTENQRGTRIISKRGSTSGTYSYQIGFQTSQSKPYNTIYFDIWYAAGSYKEIEYQSLSLNKWYYIVCTYDGSTMKMYVNGTLVSSTPCTGNIYRSTNIPLYIGSMNSTHYFCKAIIDEVRIYPKALTGDQIRISYNQMMSLSEGLNINDSHPAEQSSLTVQAAQTVLLIFALVILSKKKRKSLSSRLSPSFFIARQ
jgi:hypothetical protein